MKQSRPLKQQIECVCPSRHRASLGHNSSSTHRRLRRTVNVRHSRPVLPAHSGRPGRHHRVPIVSARHSRFVRRRSTSMPRRDQNSIATVVSSMYAVPRNTSILPQHQHRTAIVSLSQFVDQTSTRRRRTRRPAIVLVLRTRRAHRTSTRRRRHTHTAIANARRCRSVLWVRNGRPRHLRLPLIAYAVTGEAAQRWNMRCGRRA